jgi:hypothetical protein
MMVEAHEGGLDAPEDVCTALTALRGNRRREIRRMAQQIMGPKFQEALLSAVQIHGDDLRKGTSIPYTSHLLSVCALVLERYWG